MPVFLVVWCGGFSGLFVCSAFVLEFGRWVAWGGGLFFCRDARKGVDD